MGKDTHAKRRMAIFLGRKTRLRLRQRFPALRLALRGAADPLRPLPRASQRRALLLQSARTRRRPRPLRLRFVANPGKRQQPAGLAV